MVTKPQQGQFRRSLPGAAVSVRALLLLGALLLVGTGCAGVRHYGPEVGARAGFETIKPQKVAVLPFAAEDPFGFSKEEMAGILTVYESSAVSELESLGMTVVTPADVRTHLTEAGRLEELSQRLDLSRPLDELFEPAEIPDPNANQLEDDRIVFMRELAETLDVDLVVVGQVLYHTEATCDGGESSLYTPYVVFDGNPPPEGDNVRVPCAVSHFHAKLIDAKRGRTVWYNRALREVRASAPNADTPDLTENARQAVGLVITGTEASLRSILASR